MIKLPPQPFKVTEVDETHPLVVNALRDRKHFELCWCGSGKKYKKCHRLREQETPCPLGQILSLQQKIFWQKRGCMHPQASPTTCNGRVIDSHTIQRKGPLERIVDETGHVMHFQSNSTDGELGVSKTGWRKASVFPGYCAGHDSSLFSQLEREPFTGEHRQCVLQAFRNVCNELYRKQALIEVLKFQRHLMDRGRNLDEQINTQISYAKSIKGQIKSVEELERLRVSYESAIIQNELETFVSKCYFFRGDLDVVSSSVFQCEFDFVGNKLVDMWDLSIDAESLSHSVMNTDEGGAIVFVWLRSENAPNAVVTSFDNLPDEEKGDIFVQYCFLNCENTFFAERWWKGLSTENRDQVQCFANTFFYEGGEFVSNKDRLVNWSFN
ncbi:MAG: SEC-C domain-containing protein [Gammaproteobacteria bacterium]|nr:SEC-C domain-containing protein [Gammaproteobacteria bacterium]